MHRLKLISVILVSRRGKNSIATALLFNLTRSLRFRRFAARSIRVKLDQQQRWSLDPQRGLCPIHCSLHQNQEWPLIHPPRGQFRTSHKISFLPLSKLSSSESGARLTSHATKAQKATAARSPARRSLAVAQILIRPCLERRPFDGMFI